MKSCLISDLGFQLLNLLLQDLSEALQFDLQVLHPLLQGRHRLLVLLLNTAHTDIVTSVSTTT